MGGHADFGIQELGQTDISAIKKAELKERLAVMRKTFDKQIREKETALNKEVRGVAESWTVLTAIARRLTGCSNISRVGRRRTLRSLRRTAVQRSAVLDLHVCKAHRSYRFFKT